MGFRHSAGCLVAVNTYFEAPEKVAALILVAPAIVAPFIMKKGEKGNGVGEEKQMEDGDAKIGSQENPFIRILEAISKLYKFIAGFVFRILKGMRDMVGSISTKVLAMVLRSGLTLMLVRLRISPFIWMKS